MTTTLLDPAAEHECLPVHVFSEKAYFDYARYVILDRALPHVGDGLKPVQRRILYAMSELGLNATAKYKKSARTVGDCFVAGALVHTATGLKPIEEMTVGDQVLLPDGSTSAVLEVFANPPQSLLQVELNNGAALTVTPGQLFRVLNDDLSISWQRADQLTNCRVLLTNPYRLGNGDLCHDVAQVELAYIAGLLIATGEISADLSSVTIHLAANEPLEFLFNYCQVHAISAHWRPMVPSLTHHTLAYGLTITGFNPIAQLCTVDLTARQVPQWILIDRCLYLPFLAGVIDAVGHIRTKSHRRDVSIHAAAAVLLQQIQIMLADSGLHALYSPFDIAHGQHQQLHHLLLRGHAAARLCTAIKPLLKNSQQRRHSERVAATMNAHSVQSLAESIPTAAITAELTAHHAHADWYYDQNGDIFRAGVPSFTAAHDISYQQVHDWQLVNKLERMGSPLAAQLKHLISTYCVLTVVNVTPAPAAATFDVRIADERHEFLVQGCAVHNCLGKFHPHGDSACYEAMVLMAQPFSYRYPLVDGQGNWGSADDPKSFAAMRYTEARLTPYADVLLNELAPATVDWQPNFDGTLDEPKLLPARLPNVLLNGATGIAVGMATDIPPHNLREVVRACVLLLKQPDATLDDLLTCIPAPDYPTAAEIITPAADLRRIYISGNGTVRQRARYQLEHGDIVINALPYQVSGNRIMEQIAAQLQAKKLPMVEDLRDESDHRHPTRLVIVPRSNRIDTDRLMAHLFATTELEKTYRVNLNVIGLNEQPQVLGLRDILINWLEYRTVTVQRRLRQRLAQVSDRRHLLDGLLLALLNLDAVIECVRREDDPKPVLMAQLGLTSVQADFVLNTRLRQLARLEEMTVRREQSALATEQQQLAHLLGDDQQLTALLIAELETDAARYGDERRSPLVSRPPAQALDDTEVAPSEALTVILSAKGWIRAAKGHELDPAGLSFKAGDTLLATARVRSHQQVALLDSTGRSYSLPAHTLPSARGQGEPLTSRCEPPAGATFVALLGDEPERRFVFATTAGYGFLCPLEALYTRQRSGKVVLTVPPEARILPPVPAPDGQATDWRLAVVSSDGYLLLFPMNQLPELTRGKGNKLMALPLPKTGGSAATVVALNCIPPEATVTIIAGKRQLTLKPLDLESYQGERGRRGALLPRGLQRVDTLLVTTADVLHLN